MPCRREFIRSVVLALPCALALAASAHAQSGPIKILVGLPPGGAVDIGARLVGEKLQASLGQPVVVENRPGASTRIAVQALRVSEPNGQTLLVAPDAIVTLFPHVFREVGYDPFKDLTPISQVLSWSFGFAVPAASPAKTFAEFVALAKADPKFALFASPSTGSGQHVLGLQLAGLIGVKLEHVWFRGAADAMNALLSNSVPSTILTLGELTNLHQSGKARILATFTPVRTADLPDVPTFTELGYPAMQATGAVAMFGPAGMDPALTERISKAVRDALEDPEVKAKILKMGMQAKSSTPQELAAYDRAELERWRAVVQASGYVPE
ncbi:MAG: tripartite tricarboxylate transporter substrate-binding protein [Xanthobacteraceae bacterium]|jgi:tripartite-type tricarboxylate transporter receptor subunit TctC